MQLNYGRHNILCGAARVGICAAQNWLTLTLPDLYGDFDILGLDLFYVNEDDGLDMEKGGLPQLVFTDPSYRASDDPVCAAVVDLAGVQVVALEGVLRHGAFMDRLAVRFHQFSVPRREIKMSNNCQEFNLQCGNVLVRITVDEEGVSLYLPQINEDKPLAMLDLLYVNHPHEDPDKAGMPQIFIWDIREFAPNSDAMAFAIVDPEGLQVVPGDGGVLHDAAIQSHTNVRDNLWRENG